MKILYIECNMGAAGDMLMSALLELLPEPDKMIDKLNALHIPSVRYNQNKVSKCDISGTHVDVTINGELENDALHTHHHEHHHHHNSLKDIEHIIRDLEIPEKIKNDSLNIYRMLAEAESVAHGKTAYDIHFHEVGTMDAIADVVGVCMLIDEIKPEKIIASPVNVGGGTVKCEHGILPVPAPATAYILRDIPVYSGAIQSELCTPTGAALLKYFADDFSQMPLMKVSKIGYGMGTKEFDTANCIRIMLGETKDNHDKIAELCCNIDDMTGEEIGFAVKSLMVNGALDVFTIPIGMKKNRPGILLTCLCKYDDKERFAQLIFKYTTTIGIREIICSRYVLNRTEQTVKTNYGSVQIKHSTGYGVNRSKVEYESLLKIAEKHDTDLSEIRNKLMEDMNNA